MSNQYSSKKVGLCSQRLMGFFICRTCSLGGGLMQTEAHQNVAKARGQTPQLWYLFYHDLQNRTHGASCSASLDSSYTSATHVCHPKPRTQGAGQLKIPSSHMHSRPYQQEIQHIRVDRPRWTNRVNVSLSGKVPASRCAPTIGFYNYRPISMAHL